MKQDLGLQINFSAKKQNGALRKSDIHLSFFFASPLFDFNTAYTFFVSH